MKKSIPNITVSLYLICSILFLVSVSYILIRKIIFENAVDWAEIIAIIFLVAMLFIHLNLLVFKFKIVKIDNKGIEAFYPFLYKRKQILWEDFYSITAEVIDPPSIQIPAHRKMTLKGKKGREPIVEIALTDREFENFNTLTDAIPILQAKTLRTKIDIKQAQEEKYTFLLYTIASGGGVLWLLYKILFSEIKSMIVVLVLLSLFLFICSQCTRKLLWFYKVLKMNKNA